MESKKRKQLLDRLARRYFWQQKCYEVSLGLFILLLLTFIPYFVGHGLSIFIEDELNIIDQWMLGAFFLGFSTIAVLLLYNLLTTILSAWIDANWKKAYARARRDLK